MSAYDRLSYKDFNIFSGDVSGYAKKYFSPASFKVLASDAECTIVREDACRIVQRSIDIENVMFNLLSFSDSHSNKLTEQELERYIYANITNIRPLRHLSESFQPFYTFGAVRKFFFLLDSSRRKAVSIEKLAHSAVMRELFFLHRADYYAQEMEPDMYDDLVSNQLLFCCVWCLIC
jgi:hypothetical protein